MIVGIYQFRQGFRRPMMFILGKKRNKDMVDSYTKDYYYQRSIKTAHRNQEVMKDHFRGNLETFKFEILF